MNGTQHCSLPQTLGRDADRAIIDAVGDDRLRPRSGLFASRSLIARVADDHLPGFGER